jgi:hypothetical protein
MQTLAEVCGTAVAFTYRSIDRLVLNTYIPTLQTPGAMAHFLRAVCRKPILSGHVFKWLTERFVREVDRFARAQRIPVLRPKRRTLPGKVGQKALQAAARANRWGVVAIVVHQESARVFASYHAGGRPTNFRGKEDWRLVNHYYFYLRDREAGEGFVRISSYPPFQTRLWLNAHGFVTAQLRQQGVPFETADNCLVHVADPAALQRAADQFDAPRVDQIARRWLGWVPDPLTPAERAAGYPTWFSIYQAEFSDNLIFRQTQVLNRVYEDLRRDRLHLGRVAMLKVLFARRVQRNTPTLCQTRILRQGVVSCLKVFYKKSFLKQYNKGGRGLRTEVCINDPRDFTLRKSLAQLGRLATVAHHALTRFLKAQTVALATAIERSTFERLITPSLQGGQRLAGLRFGAPRVMRVLAALGCAGLTFRAFSNADLRTLLVDRFGADPAEWSAPRMAYELATLRAKGLVRKVQGRHRYTLTDLGYRVTLAWTKLHQRLLAPAHNTLDPALRTALAHSVHRLDRALTRLNAEFDTLAHVCGLEVAA